MDSLIAARRGAQRAGGETSSTKVTAPQSMHVGSSLLAPVYLNPVSS
jgi:hypothetical protein